MFGIKMFAKTKTKRFASDKSRQQYYAIQGYYKEKGSKPTTPIIKKKNSGK